MLKRCPQMINFDYSKGFLFDSPNAAIYTAYISMRKNILHTPVSKF